MKKFILKAFGIHRGEMSRASLMFGIIFLLIATLMVIKPIRNSLFLVEFGVEKLPYVFVLVALFSALVAGAYSKLGKRIKLDVLIYGTLVFSIVSLLAFWGLLRLGIRGGWVFYAFYIWVSLFGVLTSAQFWLMATEILDAREARRLFGFIGTGAIMGGIAGGYLTKSLASFLGTENLIFMGIGFLLICIVLYWAAWNRSLPPGFQKTPQKRRSPGSRKVEDSPLRLILRSGHLTYLTVIIGLGVTVANLVDYQFSAVASRSITDPDQLTAFFGFWMSNLSLVSLLVQLLLTGKILRSMGVTASLYFLPLGLLLGALAVLLFPVLWAAVFIRVSDGSLKHSINKTGTELLQLPIPSEIKNKVKTFIDVFIKNSAEGIGGILLIILTVGLGFSVGEISLVILALITVWIVFIVKVKKEYINAFRTAIEKRTLDFARETLNLQDGSILKNFDRVFKGTNEKQIIYALDLLEDMKTSDLIPILKNLKDHPSDEIKGRVLRLADGLNDLDLTGEAQVYIDSGNQKLKTEAVRYFCRHSPSGMNTLRSLMLDHADVNIRAAALACAAEEWREDTDLGAEIDLKAALDRFYEDFQAVDTKTEKDQFVKTVAAGIIGEADNPELFPSLHVLLEDSSVKVLQAAVQSLGRLRADEFIPVLFKHLGTKHVRNYAREALAAYGPSIVGKLSAPLEDDSEDVGRRLEMARTLSLLGDQKAVELLAENLEQRNLALRLEIIRSLSRLRMNFSGLRFDKTWIEKGIDVEADRFLHLLVNSRTLKDFENPRSGGKPEETVITAVGLLKRAIEERLDKAQERMFRLLGLKYTAEDMLNAYLAIKSQKAHLKASALEFLDNVLEPSLKRRLLPLVEKSPEQLIRTRNRSIFGVKFPTLSECFNRLLEGDDDWIKACTLHLIAESGRSESRVLIESLTEHPDPVVGEAARYCLMKIGVSN